MRYAVTGATGFVGGRLTRMLVDDGHHVTALVRSPGKAQALTALGVTLVPGDLLDSASLDSLLDGADGLFHVAGWYKVGARDRSDGYRINVEGTRSVLTAAQAAGTSRVVYTSTLAINSDTRGVVRDESYVFTGKHLSTYDATKAEAQRVADRFAANGVPLVTVMPGLVYGPTDTSQAGQLIRNVVAGRPVAVPSGNRLCWGYVDDIAVGHVLAMEKGIVSQRYMLAGPIHTLADLLGTAARIAGTRRPLVVPATVIGGLGVASAWLERVVPLPPTLSSEALRAATADYLGLPHKAQRELGWSARSLDEGMQETVRFLRSWPRNWGEDAPNESR
jgi:nucleoside-diphosphate-sugar epimerase